MATLDIDLGGDFDAWVEGFAGLSDTLPQRVEDQWGSATDVMFTASQSVVHVISGRLRASGSQRVDRHRRSVEGRVIYGAPYAIYEHARGGDHAFLARAYLAAEPVFDGALARAWEDEVASWRS